jgi:midasin
VLNNASNRTRLNDEAGSVVTVSPGFRLFACMNPSTDVGKKDLPPSLRNRFVEYFLHEPTNQKDLELIVREYLRDLQIGDKTVLNIVNFYAAIRKLCKTQLCDGTGHKPSFSLRTLCRALKIAARNK